MNNSPTSRKSITNKQHGFTIIELMIATVVFSLILLIVTACILQFSKQYYKGIIASSTQNTARSLMDDVVRSIQFDTGAVYPLTGGGNSGYCIGETKRYSYKLFQQVTDNKPFAPHQGFHGLVSDTTSTDCKGSAALPVAGLPAALTTTNARELLGQHMRLSRFDIAGSNNLYTVTIRVVYGDDDLLTNPTNPATNCKSTVGSQFCAVSQLTTTVKKRVN
jgi:prepilin-type N-terminal cleavage/methylation domain-containing protein